jgi:hypothetical protein
MYSKLNENINLQKIFLLKKKKKPFHVWRIYKNKNNLIKNSL